MKIERENQERGREENMERERKKKKMVRAWGLCASSFLMLSH